LTLEGYETIVFGIRVFLNQHPDWVMMQVDVKRIVLGSRFEEDCEFMSYLMTLNGALARVLFGPLNDAKLYVSK
jgi:hypothetical protein